MKSRLIVTMILLAACTQARADVENALRIQSSRGAFSGRAMERGAVYELNLRVAWDDIDKYMSLYAKWFLHVDVDGKAGRLLVTILSRELGNDRNLVFLYWYESRYKEDYYCKSAEAFFKYHLKNPKSSTRSELRGLYKDASAVLGQPERDDDAIVSGLAGCHGDGVPADVAETIRKVDAQFRSLVISDEASWNFGINPCKVGKILDAETQKTAASDDDLGGCEKSLLERSVPQAAKR